MWPTLTIFAGLGLVALHFWWKRRFDEARERLKEQTGQTAVLQEQQQLALAQAQAQQQALFNSMVEGVLLLDGNGRVRLVNQALEQLFGLTRLKQLENTRQEFVANVSHELRTPLSMIKGYVETLINGAKDDPNVATRFLKTIEKHADRLTYLIDDLLTISRLESGQIVLN